MANKIKLSDELIKDAVINGKAQSRSPSKQIEYWARIGKLADENPDLPLSYIKNVLVGIEECKAGDITEYKFG